MKKCCWIDVWPGAKPEFCIPTAYPPSGIPVSGGKRYRIEFEVPDPEELVYVDGVVTKSLCKVEEVA